MCSVAKVVSPLLPALLACALCACRSEANPAGEPPAGARPPAAAPGAAAATIEVAPHGAKLDPPVKPEQIPAGAWMCKMNSVHYASLERGDGKCPVCGMALVQQSGAAAGEPTP